METLKEDLANRDRLYAKLDEENTELHKIIQGKKDIIHKEINNLIIEHKSERKNFEDTRESQLRRIQELERILRGCELENSKLRNDYQRLADILQTNITRTIYQTFVDTES